MGYLTSASGLAAECTIEVCFNQIWGWADDLAPFRLIEEAVCDGTLMRTTCDPYKPHEQARLLSTENGIVRDAEAVL